MVAHGELGRRVGSPRPNQSTRGDIGRLELQFVIPLAQLEALRGGAGLYNLQPLASGNLNADPRRPPP